MDDIERHRKETSLAPLDFRSVLSLAKAGMPASFEDIEKLLIEMAARDQGLAARNLHNDAVHVHVAREIQIEAFAADLRPRQRLLIAGVIDRIAFDHRHFALADPVAVEVALQPSTTADVFGAVLRIV